MRISGAHIVQRQEDFAVIIIFLESAKGFQGCVETDESYFKKCGM